MRGVIIRLGKCREGAVAPTVALSLVGLIAVGGLAFDYARLAGLDTELQNAADHAALAAASQLDGKTGACQRAASAARTMIRNHALFANDGGSPLIDIANEGACDAAGAIRFYQDKAKATPATTDENAHFVEVTVASRKANYALTPIVGALSSGDLHGTAFAGLSSAICKVPPLMMCNPAESSTGGGSVNLAALMGKGILLQAGGGGAWVPGNFGYLEVGTTPNARDLFEAFGKAITSFQCINTKMVDTAPGNMAAVTDAINTRFDIYENGFAAQCGSACPPAFNTMKDLIRPSNGGCSLNPNKQNEWHPPAAADRYMPNPTTRTDPTVTVMGHPRDICHAVSENGDCSDGRIGDGVWDRNTYFRVNHGFNSATAWQDQLKTDGVANSIDPTRYDVYRWEIAKNKLAARPVGGSTYSYPAPICHTAVGPPSHPDRRVTSVAIINCIAQGVTGRTTDVKVEEWADVFFVEPSYDRRDETNTSRTRADQIYIEVIGPTKMAGGGTDAQHVRRDVPYLIE